MNDLIELFSFAFFRNALAAAALCSILAGIVGSYIVAKRNVFISGGITHASFGGLGIAYYLGWSPVLGATIFAILSSLGIEWSSHKAGLRKDSSIAILWSVGMAIGILFVFLTPGYTPNLMAFLFGDILTVQPSDLIALLVATILTSFLTVRFYQLILTVAFDAVYAQTTRLPVRLIQYLSAILIALTIVFSIKVMGIILVLSLYTIPASAANLFAKSLRKVMIGAVAVSFTGSVLGLLIAYYLDLPSGATIIFTLSVVYGILRIVKALK